MPTSKQGTGPLAHLAQDNLTPRELDVLCKFLTCIRGVDEQGRLITDYYKLCEIAGFENPQAAEDCVNEILGKLSRISQSHEATVNTQANNESTDDNMEGNQKAGKTSKASVGQRKRKATETDTNNASPSNPQPKKARTTKTSTPKKKPSKKQAGKKPVTGDDEEVLSEDDVYGHIQNEGASGIEGPVNSYATPAYPIQQHPVAPQFANSGEEGFYLPVHHQYPNIGDFYDTAQYANTGGAPPYANNGESSYGARPQYDTWAQFGDQGQLGTQALLDLEQHPNNPLLALNSDPVGGNSTLGQGAFDEQAQRHFDNNFSTNDMFSDNAQVPYRPPTDFGFGLGTFADYDNDDNSHFNSWHPGPSN
ncbi:hypothetical protein F4803DRAFT_556215 [Xylaria telfairii]|nr:hypothetical protein F4803DRAFT_556215 [Xylaria telfairii]